MTARARTIWTFAVTSIALFMVTLDNLVVTTALPVIRDELGATIERARVDRQRLHADLRRPAADRRRARRPLRAPAHVRDRPGDLHRRLGRRGARAEHRELLDRRARRPGHRRRDRDAADPDDPLRGRPGRAPRHRARRLGRRRRPRRRARPARRRRHRRGHLLAVDLLAQRAHRPRARSRSPARACARATARPPRSTCPASASSAPACSAIVWAPHPRQQPRLDEPADRRPRSSAALVVLAALRGLGAARRGADAADALLPQPHVRAGQRRLAAHVLRDVRLDLPAGPVPADRAGLLAARGRAADPALDAGADVRGARSPARSRTASAGGR